MAYQTFTIKNNSLVDTAYINRFTFADQSGQVQHAVDFTGWNSPWNSGSYSGSNDTKRTESVTYQDDVGPINAVYVDHTGTTLIVDSTSGISANWTLDGNGYTSNQTVVSITSATWLVTSAGPNGIPVPTEVITFTPPQIAMRVTNNTGVQAGWVATGNGYNGETAVSTSGTTWIIMSDAPGGTPTPGGTVLFSSTDDVMATILPGATKTFLVDYTNITSSFGDYTGDIQIFAEIGGAAVKNVNNIITISAAPAPPSSPYYEGTTGGYTGGSSYFTPTTDGSYLHSGLQGSQGFGNDATDGTFGSPTYA